MLNLRQKMAANGFESNDSYDYIVKCLQSAPGNSLRCLNIEGEVGRRKTAFATALASSLDINQILYHDFTQEEPPESIPLPSQNDDDDSKYEPPVPAFDRVLSDACAFSEAEKTVVILDQLQVSDFREHIRLYKFLIEREWTYHEAKFFANINNLYIFLISEEPIYHSLQKYSFKVWIDRTSNRSIPYQPADFQLPENAAAILEALSNLFSQLQLIPTFSEYKKIIYDIEHNVNTADDLLKSIYGWTEGIDRKLLYSEKINRLLTKIMPIIEDYIGIEENVELSANDIPRDIPQENH